MRPWVRAGCLAMGITGGCGGASLPAGDPNVDAGADGSADAFVADSAVVEVGAETGSTDASKDALAADGETGAPSLRRCATSGKGAVAGDLCFLLTPAEAGSPASGANADVDQYALRPTTGGRKKLLLFFNGSGGTPAAGARGSTTDNFYATARGAGLHVLGVSYRSDDSVGSLCKGVDACFLPTRRTMLTGKYEAGAASALAGIAVHEGALVRAYAALETLARLDPEGRWGDFIDAGPGTPAKLLSWGKILAAGHSQGGGHAAVLGKVFALDRVVTLASPCDQSAAGPASWLDPSKGAFATSPAANFHGLGVTGDPVCDGFPASWTLLGLDPSRRHADGLTCPGSNAHAAPIECAENAPTWRKMLE